MFGDNNGFPLLAECGVAYPWGDLSAIAGIARGKRNAMTCEVSGGTSVMARLYHDGQEVPVGSPIPDEFHVVKFVYQFGQVDENDAGNYTWVPFYQTAQLDPGIKAQL